MVSAPHPSSIAGEVRPVAAESIVELVREHARTRPDAVAVRSGREQVTYRRLWQRALAVAAALAEAGAGPGDRIALWADRSAGTVAGALGAMALGAAYVPIDPTHPGERTASVLAGATPTALLHDGAGQAGTLPALSVPVIDVRELTERPGLPEPALPRALDIAYIVFTSGSTGTPKGVMVEHGSLANYVAWCGDLVGRAGTGSPLFGSLGFDLAMTSLWVPLAQGGTVTTVAGIWDQDTLFGERAPEAKYTFVKMTPSHARFFDVLAEPPRYDRVTGLLMFGGEGLDPALIDSLGSRLDGVRLVNHYGPTETTIGCCAYRFDRASVPRLPTVPIGRPAWNTRAYVVDEQLRPVAPGAHGELVIAGRAVAAGYLGGAGGGRFLDEAELGGPAGARAYRTGDTVELLPEGALLYLGRGDDQLKVNGHRVELGELRHHVLAVPGVADAAFDIVRGPVDTLELFVRLGGQGPRPGTAESGEEFAALVRKTLAAALPSALVPGAVHVVDEITVNANGKTDIAATRARAGL
ncbi:amino acid adenylation domain-containing protein [Streptomyces sp. ISL-86]|uniref:amino acid adenylation domain-containing protein n=1 Tax=Streptomyces sp. ISL-86 TaxID=2819187 RepID=UPI001BE85A4B|nr:amino acid adenylation domain-containing protein [Streptomyces sp. ISL-86]MBT2454398.1 amino acid adenylation domain-containing protein [Streptomyces sp. ISL-86]